MIQHLKDLIPNYTTFLLDASGVIYNDYGPFDGTVEAIQAMQEQGNVFVVTNNSFQNQEDISHRLSLENIHIPKDNIISSGLGLKNFQHLIQDKTVYVFGSQSSHQYIFSAGAKEVTEDITQAEAIILTASYKTNNEETLHLITHHLHKNPNLPVICCNPDRVVLAKHGIHPVIGHYAEKLESLIGRDIHWIGKPLQNFNLIVKNILEKNFNIPCNQSVIFFDDNIENITTMKNDIQISNCWVKNTGIFKDDNINTILSSYPTPNHIINQLTL